MSFVITKFIVCWVIVGGGLELNQWHSGQAVYVLDGGGDVQSSGAWSGKLPGVDVGNFPDSGVDVFQVFSLHHQNGLSRVEVELQ